MVKKVKNLQKLQQISQSLIPEIYKISARITCNEYARVRETCEKVILKVIKILEMRNKQCERGPIPKLLKVREMREAMRIILQNSNNTRKKAFTYVVKTFS